MPGVKRFEDLIAWQLAERAKEEVFRLTTRARVARDRKFCEQIQDSARSAPANLSEGFALYHPKLFKHRATIARGSLEETKNHTYDGFKRGYFTTKERNDLISLTRRALGATTRLIKYLATCKAAPFPVAPQEPRTQNGEPENPRTENPRS
jgi:four helix bundle protein